MNKLKTRAEELFNTRDAKLADDTSVGGLHRYWQDRALEAESQLAAANGEIEALNEDIAEWTRMAKRKDKIIDELRAEIAQLKAQSDHMIQLGQDFGFQEQNFSVEQVITHAKYIQNERARLLFENMRLKVQLKEGGE